MTVTEDTTLEEFIRDRFGDDIKRLVDMSPSTRHSLADSDPRAIFSEGFLITFGIEIETAEVISVIRKYHESLGHFFGEEDNPEDFVSSAPEMSDFSAGIIKIPVDGKDDSDFIGLDFVAGFTDKNRFFFLSSCTIS